MRTSLAVLAALCLAGCFGSRGSVFERVPGPDSGTAAHVEAGAGDASTPAPATDSGARPPRDAGPPGDRGGDHWDGYIEAYTFDSGSDRVRIVFDSASGDGARTGVVILGDGTAPAPPTDANVGWPALPPGVPVGGFAAQVLEGFEYPIGNASVVGARVQVMFDYAALWTEWCALQTPVPNDVAASGYGCLPNTGGTTGPGACTYNDPITGDPVPVDCGKFVLCSNALVCDCVATGCTASTDSGLGQVAFDFRVTADTGDGTVSLRGGTRNVHLTR